MRLSYLSGARSSTPVLSRSSMGGWKSGGLALRKGDGTGWLDEASVGRACTEASWMMRRESIAVGALCSSSESVTTQVPGSAIGRSL